MEMICLATDLSTTEPLRCALHGRNRRVFRPGYFLPEGGVTEQNPSWELFLFHNFCLYTNINVNENKHNVFGKTNHCLDATAVAAAEA